MTSVLYYWEVKIKTISCLVLLSIAWNALFGVTNGIVLHLHSAGHGHHSEQSNNYDCGIESKDNCCYENNHLLLEAKELSELRINETSTLKLPDIHCSDQFHHLTANISIPQNAIVSHVYKRGPPITSIERIITKTVVLRV